MQLQGKKIYVADDDEMVLEAITAILKSEGATVIGGTDGKKIFTSVSFGDPDCIITDLFMPNADGFDAIGALKDFLSISCPILVLTGYASEENISRAIGLGATECMAKPVTAEKLINTVVRLINNAS